LSDIRVYSAGPRFPLYSSNSYTYFDISAK